MTLFFKSLRQENPPLTFKSTRKARFQVPLEPRDGATCLIWWSATGSSRVGSSNLTSNCLRQEFLVTKLQWRQKVPRVAAVNHRRWKCESVTKGPGKHFKSPSTLVFLEYGRKVDGAEEETEQFTRFYLTFKKKLSFTLV